MRFPLACTSRVILAVLMGSATVTGGARLSSAGADGFRGAPVDLSDHEQARAAVAAGSRLPLSALLRQIEADHPGRVLEVELEFDETRQREVYEIEILDARGRVLEIFVDALDGAYVDEPED